MPTFTYRNQQITVKNGVNLKNALKKANLSPYNGSATYLNCKGLGTCGTCALEIKDKISAKTAVEKWRLNFSPHQKSNGLRLACQVKVMGDLFIKKHDGFWGQRITTEK